MIKKLYKLPADMAKIIPTIYRQWMSIKNSLVSGGLCQTKYGLLVL